MVVAQVDDRLDAERHEVRHSLGGRLRAAVEPVRDLVEIRHARKRHRLGPLADTVAVFRGGESAGPMLHFFGRKHSLA